MRNSKSEIRSTKSETSSNKTEGEMTETDRPSVWVIVPDSDFEFVSDFVLRISDLALAGTKTQGRKD